jgi:hypothetical protein
MGLDATLKAVNSALNSDLFSYAEARAARDAGMAQVAANATPGFADVMYELVRKVAQHKPTFTSDDVFDLYEERKDAPTTHDLRAFGPVMMRAARNKICSKANVAPVSSRRPSLHASPRTVWTSLIFNTEPKE